MALNTQHLKNNINVFKEFKEFKDEMNKHLNKLKHNKSKLLSNLQKTQKS